MLGLNRHAQTDVIVLVSAADEGYVMPLAVMLTSASINLGNGNRLAVHVLDAGISPATRRRFERFAKSLHNIELYWHQCGVEAFSDLAVTHYGTAIYTRLLIGDVLPQTVHRAIYVDCDTVIESDLAELWTANSDGATIQAVRDFGTPSISHGLAHTYLAMGLPASAPYFNSGLLVIDLAKWRSQGIPRRVIEYMRKNSGTLVFPDQDGLNAVLCRNWQELDADWNVQVGALNIASADASTPYVRNLFARRDQLFNKPKIIHFISNRKPWHAGRCRPVRARFLYYLHRSGWFSPLGLAKFHAVWFVKTAALAFSEATENLKTPRLRSLHLGS